MPRKTTPSRETTKEWGLPASIPFAELKRRDLEECVYWLLDSMGAKDLEWRTGGTGGGAADGGRDLEAHFYTPTPDGEIEAQRWWIECKGRTRTVEPEEVKSAVNNALAVDGLDYVVIATNTQFSNPTRDWVKKWQRKYPKPKVKLWDQAQLERYLSRHPDVVLRLFSEALSLDGRFKAMESRFWNKLEFVTPKTLADIWKGREEVDVTAMGAFAAIANEFGNGTVSHRSWGAILSPQSLVQVLSIGLYNVPYLMIRSSRVGVDQKIICRTFAYLILASLDILPAETVTHLVSDSLNRGQDNRFPEEVQEVLLLPIVDQLLSEIQDVCSSDCKRMVSLDRSTLTQGDDEVENYWLRLEPEGVEEPGDRKLLRIEKLDETCLVGFSVDKDNRCPLFCTQPSLKNTGDLLMIIKRVAAFRKRQAADKRRSEQEKAVERHKKASRRRQ